MINKYRMRGFGTIINGKEKSHLAKYNNKTDKWGGMFSINNIKVKSQILSHFGTKKLDDKIFRPKQYLDNCPSDIYIKKFYDYVDKTTDLYNEYNIMYDNDNLMNLLKHKTINSNGSVNQLKFWVADAGYDALNE